MAWKKGQSGNPRGRVPEPALVPINPEPVYIPILKRRDPANELVRLADKSLSDKFKKDIWTFLFLQKYRAANIVPAAPVANEDDATSDVDLLKALETQSAVKPVKSKARGLKRETEETTVESDTI